MTKGNEYYSLENNDEKIRFATELSSYCSDGGLKWRDIHLKNFIGVNGEKKVFPYKVKIQKDEKIEEVTIIKFIYINEMSEEFRTHNDHWVLLALMELNAEKVIVPCS